MKLEIKVQVVKYYNKIKRYEFSLLIFIILKSMSIELLIGILLGIISAFLSEYLLYLFKREVYEKIFTRRKYKNSLENILMTKEKWKFYI